MLTQRIMETRAGGTERLRTLLTKHPGIGLEAFEISDHLRIEFRQGDWVREVVAGHPGIEGPYGLVELMDNNPLVCADRASCPGAAATLALIGFGPLIRAGLILERPSALFSFDGDYDEVDAALASMGWPSGATCAGNPVPLGGVVSVTCVASVRVPKDVDEIEGLFDEAYGRSFFVRRVGIDQLDENEVRGAPYALYSLALTQGEEGLGTLRIQVVADLDGKCGSAQLVHMFNVMAGFEEDLGIGN